MANEPSVAALASLLRHGHALVPSAWRLHGAEQTGLWWRVGDTPEVVATPALVRLAAKLPTEGEAVAAIIATTPAYRGPWLELEAARLRDLGRRSELPGLCDAIDVDGPAAAVLRGRVSNASLSPTGRSGLELALFGGTADQPVAALPLRRALGCTAPLVEGARGTAATGLAATHPLDPSLNWIRGRLLQAPGAPSGAAGPAVLSGHVPSCEEDRMRWALGTPWVTLLAVLGFTAEAWAAERRGGVQLELPMSHVESFGAPTRVDVAVTLADGHEVLCGSLGELCLSALDGLGMALVPSMDAAALDGLLAEVVATMLRAGVWVWQPDARPRYTISDSFSFDCYRGLGHRYIYRAGDELSQVLRSSCFAWARARLGVSAVAL